MRRRVVHILLPLALLLLLAGCGHRGRRISPKKFTKIYAEMFLADQWLRDSGSSMREAADTTLFFDPIFRRYGCRYEDFNKTLDYYLEHPEKYSKALSRSSESLRKVAIRLAAESKAEQEHELHLAELRALYRHQDFSTDSARWSKPGTLWPPKDPIPPISIIVE